MDDGEDFEHFVVSSAPSVASCYRLQFEKDGDLRQHPQGYFLRLDPFEEPEIRSGLYTVLYFDANNQLLRHKAVRATWVYPAKGLLASNQPTESSAGMEQEAREAALSMELEKINHHAKKLHGKSELVADSLTLFRGFQQVMGAQSTADYKVRNEQMALMAESAKQMMQTQLSLLEAFKKHADMLKTPPPPPPPTQWDKLVAAGLPAFAAMYIETIRAIKSTGRKGDPEPSVAELLVPADAKLKKLYELLGNVADADRLETLLKDQKGFAAWVATVKSMMNTEAEPKEEPKQDE
jgi:hypothetical protein